jgi:hypothetical protein
VYVCVVCGVCAVTCVCVSVCGGCTGAEKLREQVWNRFSGTSVGAGAVPAVYGVYTGWMVYSYSYGISSLLLSISLRPLLLLVRYHLYLIPTRNLV